MKKNEGAHEYIQKSLVVKGWAVVKYHRDGDSEDDEDSVNSSEEEDDDEDEDEVREVPIGDNTLTPRYAMCDNCMEDFDITKNERGD